MEIPGPLHWGNNLGSMPRLLPGKHRPGFLGPKSFFRTPSPLRDNWAAALPSRHRVAAHLCIALRRGPVTENNS